MHINGSEITNINFDGRMKIKCSYFDKPQFKTNWARIKPFVIAYGRELLYYKFRKYEDDIVYVHTDGVLLKDGPHEIFLSDKLGGLKHEGTFDVNIVGFNKKNKTPII